MRIAILSDIHGNLPALEQVFSHLGSVQHDAIFCLGDMVGYGPFPNECIELIRAKCLSVIAGNHDWAVIQKDTIKNFNAMGKKTLKWTQKRLTKENAEYLGELQRKTVWNNMTFAHASPLKPEDWSYIFTYQEAEEAFQGFKTPVCFIGHTHVPALISEDLSVSKLQRNGRFIINVGSVGQPRDGNPKSSFGIFDTENWSFDIIRLEYDIQKTIDALKKNKFPAILGRRLLYGF